VAASPAIHRPQGERLLRLLRLRSVNRNAALAHAAYENLARTLQRMVENEAKDERELEIAFVIRVDPESQAVKAERVADGS
jgi:hypothetical protein